MIISDDFKLKYIWTDLCAGCEGCAQLSVAIGCCFAGQQGALAVLPPAQPYDQSLARAPYSSECWERDRNMTACQRLTAAVPLMRKGAQRQLTQGLFHLLVLSKNKFRSL